ncbi:MAG: substrate-binding domain-containing protein [Candidatus Devosia euplotis]|nr:substrate-binding domain-containing protein [Candidatus Devosia euplotis]
MAEGRRKYLVLAGLKDGWAVNERTKGYVGALRAAGHEPLMWHSQSTTIEVGKACAAAFLDLPAEQRPEAVFSTNDAMALGFYDGLRGAGVSIPDDLSLIDFDNLSASSWTLYQLTTFEQPIDTMVSQVLHYIDSHRREDDGAAAPVSPE